MLKIKRLNWAGILINSEGCRLMIDPVYSCDKTLFGSPKEPFYPLSEEEGADAILITHLHSDHFDAESIIESFGNEIPLFVPKGEEDKVKEKGFKRLQGLAPKEFVEVGPFTVYAENAVDGLGDPQVSLVVKDSSHSIFHGGDTLWHGYWWGIAKAHGRFNGVFLTINEAIVQDGDMTPSGMPITMSPEQAVAAARILEAETLIPIHYHAFMNPPRYIEGENLLGRLQEEAQKRGQSLQVMKPGERLVI